MKFFEICAEVLVPKFTRAEVRLPDSWFIWKLDRPELSKGPVTKAGGSNRRNLTVSKVALALSKGPLLSFWTDPNSR